MRSFFTQKALKLAALIFAASLVAPAPLMLAPQTAHAQYAVAEVGGNLITNLKTTIESTLNTVSTITNTAANYAQYVNKYILEPIAFVTSGNLIKSLTAGILKFVSGATNGTGKPQFVQNILGHLQGVGDIQAISFFNQYSTLSNSPFAPAITSSLRRNYLQNTSLAGWFAKNKCTLDQNSSDIVAYAKGDWSKGGWSAWFSLTTKDENDPYSQYQAAQNQLSTVVNDAVSARLTELNWGQGFLSWCGTDSTISSDTSSGNSSDTQGSSSGSSNATSGSSGTNDSSIVSDYTTSGGNAPGDACTNADGTPGTIQTPGSFIKDKLVQVTGLEGLKLANMGNVGPEINSIMKDISTVTNTIGTASSIFNDVSSGGLAGIGGSSQLSDYQTRAGYLGVTENSVSNNASTIEVTWKEAAARVNDYETAWTSLSGMADKASAALTSMADACSSNHQYRYGFDQTAASYVTAATQAQTNLVDPVVAQAQTASTTIASARALIAKIEAEQNSTTLGSGGAYGADVQALQAAPPSASDVLYAQIDTKPAVQHDVAASPSGSLNISGGTIYDRMNLIVQNAGTMQNACVQAYRTSSAP